MIRKLRTACYIAGIMTLMIGSRIVASEPGAPARNGEAPAFTGEKLDGGILRLESLRGHVVLLNFWAVACPPCRIEMPELEKIHRRYAGRGLQVLGVTEMDPTPGQVRDAIAEMGVTYPILLDPGAGIASLYGIKAHPTSFVIDAKGIVRFVNSGYLKGEEIDIEREIRKALGFKGSTTGAPGAPQTEKP